MRKKQSSRQRMSFRCAAPSSSIYSVPGDVSSFASFNHAAARLYVSSFKSVETRAAGTPGEATFTYTILPLGRGHAIPLGSRKRTHDNVIYKALFTPTISELVYDTLLAGRYYGRRGDLYLDNEIKGAPKKTGNPVSKFYSDGSIIDN